MLKVMSRYKNQIMSIAIAFVIVFGGICSVSFNSSAASYNFDMPYGQPTTSVNSGYLEVLGQAPDGSLFCDVFYWNIVPLLSTSVVHMGIEVDYNGHVVFMPEIDNGNERFSYCLMYMGNNGNVSIIDYGSYLGYDIFDYNVSVYNSKVISYRVYGNFEMNSDNLPKPMPPFTCVYGSDSLILSELASIYNQLVIANANDTQMINTLNNIMSSNVSIDSKLSQLIELQQSTNTWLEKIWNSIQEFFTPDDEDKETTDKFKEDSDKQSSELNELNQQNKTDKVDVGSASGSVDANIDENAIQNYGTVLSVFTNHEYILKSILVVLAIGLVAYVLFGKK